MTTTIAGRAPFLEAPGLRRLMMALKADGEEARIAGGAVRDALIGRPTGDVDIATTVLPSETIARAEAAGLRAVPTGIDHGTITVIADGVPYEVTTLRSDIETDGRHAKVAFGRDWQKDAERRDFTINGLYAEGDGTVIDLVGGLADLDKRLLRFIGEPEQRIREDYLRILRFFRFFAWFGTGRPDAEGLKACVRLKEGVTGLSAERIWTEMRKLLTAPDPSRALLWMRTTGVLTLVLPESEKWGIDAIHGLVSAEQARGWTADPLLRLASIIPPNVERIETLSKRLRLSKAETKRLEEWAAAAPAAEDETTQALARRIHAGSREGITNRLRLQIASQSAAGNDAAPLEALLSHAEGWKSPPFPISGADLMANGVPAGPELGRLFKQLEAEWSASDFTYDREALLARASSLIETR
ncbi:CCA tRNA nucleotidyltransferase [Tianweitania populi]|uniref:Cytidine(C)-cytidine(C)-adenosine (A)]-adding enzyme n=1 Tax=Tianweitania populi TaxID=1607949 RepID=A0A8J3GLG1_9HYPH|nr:CCA tRNA nucleotidyltransferase [Tianweitania populi]GHD11828.1 cytidine(C)-cytidine(C)-adenosine (A)]-adding enzyme [Tianweitania populi]